MKKTLLFLFVATLAVSGCRKEPEPEPPDPYAAFKADATPRWEIGSTVEKNEGTTYTFIKDIDGQLFETSKYTTGRITQADGNSYEFIEFTGPPVVGKPSDPSIRTMLRRESSNLYSLEILKIEGDKLWIVFKESAGSTERRVVQ